MNEVNEIKKIVKISSIVGGVWGFMNGLFLILSSVDSAPNTTFFGAIVIGSITLLVIITNDFI